MAVGTTTAITLGLMAASAAAQQYNTQRTARKQDNALADSIRNQSRKQREADARVSQQVQELQGSTSADEQAKAMAGYVDQLRRNKAALDSGLTGQTFGSDAFKAAGEAASGKVQDATGEAAGLMSRIDAPAMQRLGEGFSQQRLATDIGLIGRESQGQRFMDELRLRAIRRNPWLDAAAAGLGAAAGSMGGGAAPAASAFGPYASGYRFPGGG